MRNGQPIERTAAREPRGTGVTLLSQATTANWLLVAAMAVLCATLLRRAYGRLRRSKNSIQPQRVVPPPEAPVPTATSRGELPRSSTLDRWEVALYETGRYWAARLDNKIVLLEQVTRDADERIARLEQLLAAANAVEAIDSPPAGSPPQANRAGQTCGSTREPIAEQVSASASASASAEGEARAEPSALACSVAAAYARRSAAPPAATDDPAVHATAAADDAAAVLQSSAAAAALGPRALARQLLEAVAQHASGTCSVNTSAARDSAANVSDDDDAVNNSAANADNSAANANNSAANANNSTAAAANATAAHDPARGEAAHQRGP